MSEPKIHLIEGEITALNLALGDRLVVKVNGVASQNDLAFLREMLTEWAPGIPCLIVSDVIDISVVRE